MRIAISFLSLLIGCIPPLSSSFLPLPPSSCPIHPSFVFQERVEEEEEEEEEEEAAPIFLHFPSSTSWLVVIVVAVVVATADDGVLLLFLHEFVFPPPSSSAIQSMVNNSILARYWNWRPLFQHRYFRLGLPLRPLSSKSLTTMSINISSRVCLGLETFLERFRRPFPFPSPFFFFFFFFSFSFF